MRSIMKIFHTIRDAVNDPERDFSERVFLILTWISEVMVLIALLGDIILGDSIYEIMILVVTLIAVPIISLTGLYKDKIRVSIRIIVIAIVFVVIPSIYFCGGGIKGGGFLWFIFTFMYVGLVLHGRWRRVMIISVTVISVACCVVEYYHPNLVYIHTRQMFFMDSCLALVMVGIVCFVMTWAQNRFFLDENRRAKKEAERAEELTRSQNRFFSSMSHEIRTPINSILGLNELILRDENTSDEVVRDATGIQGAGKMLLALINDILDFSKIEAGSMDIIPVDYKIGDMLSEIVNMMWLRAHDKGLTFNINVDPEVPAVLYGDEIRIKQIIINLLNNAVKYTKEGSVELRIESRDVDENTIELWITISDTGMGIKKEDIPYLFDAFKRVDEDKNKHIEGTGLGLSIVRQLVELMNGTITVNSTYGEGSAFTVMVRQIISDHNRIGELNIHNQSVTRKNMYEASFMAPEARILIVDDNEMNLRVEQRLLADTGMGIDEALSGRAALDMTLKHHYDVILMDHLMPEMNGIDCLKELRQQPGGLNRSTPVLVLTANAGSENRDLYNRSGFDGYLVKPVSGEALEEALRRHISPDKLILTGKLLGEQDNINASALYTGKMPVMITSTSLCDLPDTVIKKFNLSILPLLVYTDEGVFKDGVQMDADEMIRYMRSGGNTRSSVPDEASYIEFFSNNLKRAHHLIHIAVTTSMSDDFKIASETAKTFDNVTVINSESVSSATGILVLIAQKLAGAGIAVENIVSELEEVKRRLQCSFIIDTTDFMVKKELVSKRAHTLTKALNLHPCLQLKEDRSGIGGLWMGSTRRAYRRYIKKALSVDVIPDEEIAFVTYADVPLETLLWIKEEISKTAYFDRIVFQQASAAVSSNCGPGSFGILYFVKSNKSYNLGSFFEDEKEFASAALEAEEELTEQTDEIPEGENEGEDMPDQEPEPSETTAGEEKEPLWYEGIPFIDGTAAIKNSGSEDAFKTVLKIFYESIPEKTAEIEGYYACGDWENYTIKVHALKSSARLIGALSLADDAQLLEDAGKTVNIDFIRENHGSFMEDYKKFEGILAGIFTEEKSKEDKPLADEYLIQDTYEGLQMAAEAMDCDMIEAILSELEPYAFPGEDEERLEKIRECAGNYDYDGILDVLREG